MQRSISRMLFLLVLTSLVTVQQTQGQQVIIGQRVPADQRVGMDSPYLPNREAYKAVVNNAVRVSYLKYDWSLNEQKQAMTQGSANRSQGSGRR